MESAITTVHLVFNAHIDPVWLWPWQAGMDETLATCRTACDLLDDNPDFIFTKGEAWSYDLIQRVDPALFSRLQGHVRAGRWEVTGGWWIQPDCNVPSGFAMEKQIGIGKEYFDSNFGASPKVAYNVDSFGHSPTLPGYMRAAGQEFYVMMRPQEHELELPTRLFRWRGYSDGPEVITFRIARAYTARQITEEHIRAAASNLPPGVHDTMCFLGVGDHGGGATAGQIAWCREHADAFEGLRLEFSSPARFFAKVAGLGEALPLVVGELQHHAIGCYSVRHDMKAALRRAEHRVRQAELFNDANPGASAGVDVTAKLRDAWEQICFNHFHDTLGGTCIPSAYGQAIDQLGQASSIADTLLHTGLRVLASRLPNDPLQRMALYNASDTRYDGFVQFEPWTEYRSWEPSWQLLDEDGSAIPVQLVHGESAMAIWQKSLLFKLSVEPGAMRVLRICTDGAAADAPPAAPLPDPDPENSIVFELPEVHLIRDATDNWSHGIDRFPEEPEEVAEWEPAIPVDPGPFMWSSIRRGSVGKSTLKAELRHYPGERYADLHLKVRWLDEHALLKLVIPLPGDLVSRVDGVMGGSLARPLSGVERPFRDWSLISFGDGTAMGVVSPDVFGIDADEERVRLTLLRNAISTHHDPFVPEHPRAVMTDTGEHSFIFRFFVGQADVATLESHAMMLHRPLVIADVTKGMPRFTEF